MAIDLNQILSYFPATIIPSINWSALYFSLLASFLLFVLLFLFFQIIRLILLYKQQTAKHVYLEIKPLKKTELNPYSTEQLFNLFHSITNQKSFVERIFRVTKIIGLEIVSTKAEGIRYVIRAPQSLSGLTKNSLLSYLPGIQINKTTEYLQNSENSFTTQLKLAKHFAFPLKAHENLDQNDPIAYLTGAMTKLKEKELLAYQVVISPVSKSKLPEVKRLQKLIRSKQDLTAEIAHAHSGAWVYLTISYMLQILLLPLGLLVFLATDGRDGPLLPLPKVLKGKKASNAYQSEIEKLVKKKIDQLLYKASIRVLSQSTNEYWAKKNQKGLFRLSSQ